MKFIIQIFGFAAGAYVLVVIALYFFQEKMLFYPMGSAYGNCPEMTRKNARAVSKQGIRYYMKEKKDAVSWIVIFYGNGGSACDRGYFLDLLDKIPVNIVVFEYPGYGRDNNRPGEKIILVQALALIQEIKRANTSLLPIYLLGESLGTGVATFVASKTQVSGLILVSAYTSISALAQKHYPFFPVRILLRHPFRADLWAQKVFAPVLIFHGKNDDIIPIEFSREQIGNFKGKSELVELDNCGHNDIISIGETMIRAKIQNMVARPAEL